MCQVLVLQTRLPFRGGDAGERVTTSLCAAAPNPFSFSCLNEPRRRSEYAKVGDAAVLLRKDEVKANAVSEEFRQAFDGISPPTGKIFHRVVEDSELYSFATRPEHEALKMSQQVSMLWQLLYAFCRHVVASDVNAGSQSY
jgi:hypothetical protein